MNIQTRQLLLCVSASETLHRIETVAEDLGILLLSTEGPEAIFDHPELTHVESIVVEFAEFGDEASFFIDNCRQRSPGIPVIVLLPQFSVAEAFRAGQCGVFNCFDFLATEDEWAASFQSAHCRVSQIQVTDRTAATEPWRRYLVGQSPSLTEVTKIIRLVASRRCTVLISGETGTGKEMAARALHMASDRARRPMVTVNCSAIPENLIEAELSYKRTFLFQNYRNAHMRRSQENCPWSSHVQSGQWDGTSRLHITYPLKNSESLAQVV